MSITILASVMRDNTNNMFILNQSKGISQLPVEVLWTANYIHEKKIISDYYTFSNRAICTDTIIVYTPKQIDYVKDDKSVSFCNYINWEAVEQLPDEYVVYGGLDLISQAIPFANKIRLFVLDVYGDNHDSSNIYLPSINSYAKWIMRNIATVEKPPQYKSLLQQDLTLHNMSLLEFVKI